MKIAIGFFAVFIAFGVVGTLDYQAAKATSNECVKYGECE